MNILQMARILNSIRISRATVGVVLKYPVIPIHFVIISLVTLILTLTYYRTIAYKWLYDYSIKPVDYLWR